MSSPRLTHLLSPGRIGTLEVRNRIFMSPMGDDLGEGNGHVSERQIRYYEARARGRTGLIIVGVGAIAYPEGCCEPNQVGLSDDRFLPGLQRLTERVHAHGAKIAIQIQHAGKVSRQDTAAGRPLWVPSVPEVPARGRFDDLTPDELQLMAELFKVPGGQVRFHALTLEDIAAVTEKFADAALRCRRAGFDGVEIHGAHGYLISSFLSPVYNKRSDAYGGSVDNRARLLAEVIRAVKQRAGTDFPAWCRLDGSEIGVDNGITPADAQRAAELAEAAGADAIHVSAAADPNSGVAFTDAPIVHQPCGFVDLAVGIKRRVHIPVIAVGRIEPAEADALIRDGKADFVAMGRKLLADPELPKKLTEGRPEDVRPCVYCYTCVEQHLGRPVVCAVNPATAREAEFEIIPAPVPRRVLVIGGGPAGMETARVAALRGHQVTLVEKSDRLGGTLWFAALVYEPNGRLLEHLEAQVRKLPIALRLGQVASLPLVQELRPDVIVIAVGARRQAPSIPGVDRAHVFSGDDLRSLMSDGGGEVAAQKLSLAQRAMLKMGGALGISDRVGLTRELTRHWMPLGTRVVVIGGGLVGVELAEFLIERGRQVTVLEEGSSLGKEMPLGRRWRVLHTLRQHGARLITDAHTTAITDAGVVYGRDGTSETAPAESVILAVGTQENHSLAEAIKGSGAEVHLIGDCTGVGYIKGAMLDANRIARMI